MLNRSNKVLFTPTQKAVPAVADLSSFYQIYSEVASRDDADSGINILSLFGTPSGIVRIVSAVYGGDASSATDRVSLRAVINGDVRQIVNELNLSAKEGAIFSGQIILDENDYIAVAFWGCNAGDQLILNALGYDVKKY